MAITWVQDDQATGSSAAPATTFTSNTTSNNLIIAVVSSGSGGINIRKMSDSAGNNYNLIAKRNEPATSVSMEIWYAVNITGGTTPTVTALMGISRSWLMSITEVSGLSTTNPLDLIYIAPAITPAGNIWSLGPTMLPRADNEFVFVAANTDGTGLTWSAGTGYSNVQQQSLAGNGILGTQSKVISARAAQTPQFTLNGSTSGLIACITFADVPIEQTEFNTQINNYQFPKAGDGMSVTEKIR